MAETLQLNNVVTTANVQGAVNIIWYVILGLFGTIIIGVILWKIWQHLSYKYHVFVYKKIGDTEIVFEDGAKQIKLEGEYLFHYRKMNKYSPVIDNKYFRIVQKPLFGIFPGSKLGFNAYLYGESLFPIEVHSNPGLSPIDLDLFNYLTSRLRANQQKYTKQNWLLQMAPVIGIGLVVVMFIVGMIFYTKHVENISQQVIAAAQWTSDKILTNTGAAQVITGQ